DALATAAADVAPEVGERVRRARVRLAVERDRVAVEDCRPERDVGAEAADPGAGTRRDLGAGYLRRRARRDEQDDEAVAERAARSRDVGLRDRAPLEVQVGVVDEDAGLEAPGDLGRADGRDRALARRRIVLEVQSACARR